VNDFQSTFALWNPVSPGSDELAFDVRPLEQLQLNTGSNSLIESFLDCLGIRAEPLNWEVTPFCSPYFAANDPGGSHLDRYPMAWRVKVRFPGSVTNRSDLDFFGPHVCDGIDPTWTDSENCWIWTRRECVIIADFSQDRRTEFLPRLQEDPVFQYCRRFEIFGSTPLHTQARFELGLLEFPESAPIVDTFTQACKLQSASVNWATSLRRSLG